MSAINIHVFVPSGFHTYTGGKPICGECGSVKAARVHEVPEVPETAREIDQRRLGELDAARLGLG